MKNSKNNKNSSRTIEWKNDRLITWDEWFYAIVTDKIHHMNGFSCLSVINPACYKHIWAEVELLNYTTKNESYKTQNVRGFSLCVKLWHQVVSHALTCLCAYWSLRCWSIWADCLLTGWLAGWLAAVVLSVSLPPVSLPQLEGDSAFLRDAFAARWTVFSRHVLVCAFIISDWKITGSAVRPPLAPRYTQEWSAERTEPERAASDAASGCRFDCIFTRCSGGERRGGRQEQRSTGVQQPGWIATCFLVLSVTAVGACVCLHEAAGWGSQPAVSPPPDTWSPLDLRPTKDDNVVWIWNGACRWAKFSASEKHRNHGQSSAVSVCVCVCVCVCVLTSPTGCLTDGAALTETAASRCGCSLTGGIAHWHPGTRTEPVRSSSSNRGCVCVRVCLLCYHVTVCCCAVFNGHKKGGVCVILAMCVWVCLWQKTRATWFFFFFFFFWTA